MSELLERAMERRAQLATQLAEIDRLIAEQAELERRIKLTLDNVPRHDPQIAFDEMPEGMRVAMDARRRGPNGSPPDQIVAAAEEAIRQNNAPMTRYELVEAVEATGLTVGGVDKPRNIGTILWRSKRFDNDGEGYRPKGWSPGVILTAQRRS